MRPLTEQEEAQLHRARAALGPCVDRRHELLAEFLTLLGLPDAHRVSQDAGSFLPAVAAWVDAQEVGPDDGRAWLHLRLAVFIGEVLAQRLGGSWSLDGTPGSPHFGVYVVGKFAGAPPEMVVNSFDVANAYLGEVEARGPVRNATGATTYVLPDGSISPSLLHVVAGVVAGVRR